ncbi:MAG TPA: gluconate 2-dehydrogenase subunit 3 family protein [Gemmatimonadaceae bacterium]|nr:gluconate 2-dehydrogenase subunit 3 family protein [Gemmatimonadaceae bacterium]
MPPPPDRRAFLSTSISALGGGWLLAALPALASLSACARDAASRGDPLTTLSPAEGEAMQAFAAQILPSDELPGATEAGAVYFIDAALAGPFAGMLPLIREGLANLDVQAATAGGARFTDLPSDGQRRVMRQIEESPFFFSARMLTIMGVLSDPKYGGNRGGVGYQLVRRETAATWQPPFGYYDAEAGTASGGAS